MISIDNFNLSLFQGQFKDFQPILKMNRSLLIFFSKFIIIEEEKGYFFLNLFRFFYELQFIEFLPQEKFYDGKR
jgi:hypothetical protein